MFWDDSIAREADCSLQSNSPGLETILGRHQVFLSGIKGNAHENRRDGKGDSHEQIRYPFY